jgi:hypothetical protein
MLPFFYPGIQVSYGKVQQVAAGAEQKAAAFNAREDLSGPVRLLYRFVWEGLDFRGRQHECMRRLAG